MKRNKHIVLLTPGFAVSKEDSVTIPALQGYLKSLQNSLNETKLTLISFQFPFTTKTYTWNGIKVIPLNGRNKRLKKLWTWRKALQTLEHLHKKHPINTIHSFWIGECSMIGGRFAKKHNINHLTTVMGQDAIAGNSYLKYLQRSNTKVVTLSKNQHTELSNNYALDSTIIPWYLDISSFPVPQKSTIDILGVGSLNSVKNYSLFIEIIAELIKTHPNLTVEIIGEGHMRSQLEKQIQQLQLNKHIKLVGEIPRTKVLEKMTQATILLHSSTYESFGFVFLEALYAGMHIVSHNVGVAKDKEAWTICSTQKEMIDACLLSLSKEQQTKKRISISSAQVSLSAYIKLYYE